MGRTGTDDYGNPVYYPDFNTDVPDCGFMFQVYADCLDELNCNREAELMRLQWGIRFGQVISTPEIMERIKELQKEFGVQPTKRITKPEYMVNGRERQRPNLITAYFEDPMGLWYTKFTCNIIHVERFLDELHGQPIMTLCLQCNETAAPGLIHKYLNYPWLQKCINIELNNVNLEFPAIRQLFADVVVKPNYLKISGRPGTIPTDAQLKVLPLICPNLRNLWRIEYYGKKYSYV